MISYQKWLVQIVEEGEDKHDSDWVLWIEGQLTSQFLNSRCISACTFVMHSGAFLLHFAFFSLHLYSGFVRSGTCVDVFWWICYVFCHMSRCILYRKYAEFSIFYWLHWNALYWCELGPLEYMGNAVYAFLIKDKNKTCFYTINMFKICT